VNPGEYAGDDWGADPINALAEKNWTALSATPPVVDESVEGGKASFRDEMMTSRMASK